MRKINLCLIMIIIFAYPVFSANDTDYFRWNNPVDWLDNQRKPISGEKIFRNFTDLAHHIRTDSEAILLIIQSDSEAKNYRMNLLESDSVIKNVRIYNLENFKENIEDTFLSKNNTEIYTPIGDYNPVTKKYVIDLLTEWIGSDSTSSRIDTMLVLNVTSMDSTAKNDRIIILENFKNNINDTFYTETEINNLLNLIGIDTDLLKTDISNLNTKLNNISGDSIISGEISYLYVENKFLRNDIEDTGKKLNINGDLYVSDTFTVDGKIILGKVDGFGNKPDLELNANLKTDLIPFGNNYNLGSSAQRWHYAYVDSMVVTTLGADSTEISGTLLNNFTINSGNDTFDNSSLTFYQADTETSHGNIMYRYSTDDFLINKTTSINGDILSNGELQVPIIKTDSVYISEINKIDTIPANPDDGFWWGGHWYDTFNHLTGGMESTIEGDTIYIGFTIPENVIQIDSIVLNYCLFGFYTYPILEDKYLFGPVSNITIRTYYANDTLFYLRNTGIEIGRKSSYETQIFVNHSILLNPDSFHTGINYILIKITDNFQTAIGSSRSDTPPSLTIYYKTESTVVTEKIFNDLEDRVDIIENWDTMVADWDKTINKPYIPDTSPYALQSTVDAIVTDTAEWSKIANKPSLGIDTTTADLRYANINRGVVYLDDWKQILDFSITTTENIFNVLNGCTFTLFSNSNETSYFNAKLDLKNCGLPTDTPNYLICQIIISYNNSELQADTLNYEQNFTAIGLLKKNEITPSIFNCVKKQYSQNYYYSLNAGINTDKTLYINAQFNNIYWCSRRIKLWIVGYGY